MSIAVYICEHIVYLLNYASSKRLTKESSRILGLTPGKNPHHLLQQALADTVLDILTWVGSDVKYEAEHREIKDKAEFV